MVFPNLDSESLLSIKKNCDDGCIALFDDKILKVYKNDTEIRTFLHETKQDNLVLKGKRNKQDGLYDVPFQQLKLNYIITKDKNKLELAQYLHGCAWSPAISTFQACINKGNFVTWPGIEEVKFKKLLGTPLPTALGHLDQERKNLQSTNGKDELDDAFPAKILHKTMNCFYVIINILAKQTAYSDQTGKFPVQSSRGNNYFFVCYDYDSNAILSYPIKIENQTLY